MYGFKRGNILVNRFCLPVKRVIVVSVTPHLFEGLNWVTTTSNSVYGFDCDIYNEGYRNDA